MNAVIERPSMNQPFLDEQTVSKLMTRSLLVAKADWRVTELAEFLVGNGISGAPVVDSRERVVGVVSVTDIARHTSMVEDEPGIHHHQYYTDTLDFTLDEDLYIDYDEDEDEVATVRDIMTPAVFDVDINTSIRSASAAMVKNRIHRVLVSDRGKVVGIVSALDILALLNDC